MENEKTEILSELTDEEEQHTKIMREVLHAISNENSGLVLKGGSCLSFGYESERPSQDLDFDSPYKSHKNISQKITEVFQKLKTRIKNIDLKKDSTTAKNIHITYLVGESTKTKKLKVEISFRNPPEKEDYQEKEGVLYSNLSRLLDGKMHAFFERTKARDLYDLVLLAEKYPDAFALEHVLKLKEATDDVPKIIQKYRISFRSDPWLNAHFQLDDLVQKLVQVSEDLQKQAIASYKNNTTESNEDKNNPAIYILNKTIIDYFIDEEPYHNWNEVEGTTIFKALLAQTSIEDIQKVLIKSAIRRQSIFLEPPISKINLSHEEIKQIISQKIRHKIYDELKDFSENEIAENKEWKTFVEQYEKFQKASSYKTMNEAGKAFLSHSIQTDTESLYNNERLKKISKNSDNKASLHKPLS